ncbi:NAD(P)-binding domain protein [Moelleriella libera RCEF 2490]|uniref:NAD(P)-binding domain protein n=1 Tax=Moelleriella libera RCEF 2490 TaxID=1081109 RepID=A0A168A0R8_9HYPO|nr:NAD(P)-binding domain protein [Moelleriella libera RCEF 2490]
MSNVIDSSSSSGAAAAAAQNTSAAVDVSQPYDASTLKNKTIVITGGSNGLGAAMVREWASHGASVMVGDLDDAAGEALIAELRAKYHVKGTGGGDSKGPSFGYVHCDVTSWEDQRRFFEDAQRLSPTGRLDIVVPNAGIIQPSQSADFEHPGRLDADGKLARPSTKTVDVNITGVLYTVHLGLWYFSQSRSARDHCILLVGSVASVLPLVGQTHYTLSKHAVCGLFRSLRATAFAQQPGRVRVNMIAPYFVEQSRMFPPVTTTLFLGGSAGGATVEDVTNGDDDDGTHEGAGIMGRPVQGHEGRGHGRAVWDLYAHDHQQVDSFTHRYIALINAVAKIRGVRGFFVDVWRKLIRRE